MEQLYECRSKVHQAALIATVPGSVWSFFAVVATASYLWTRQPPPISSGMCDQIVVKLPPQAYTRKLKLSSINDCSSGECTDSVAGAPLIVNFHRFNKLDTNSEEVPGIKNKHLVHAVAALYDRALPDVTEDVIYSTINEKWARTILIVQDPDEALESFKQRTLCSCKNTEASLEGLGISPAEGRCSKEEQSSVNAKRVIHDHSLPPSNDIPIHPSTSTQINDPVDTTSRFSEVFSDMDTSDEEDEGEEEDFSIGVEHFLQDLRERQQKKQVWLDSVRSNNCAGEPKDLIGVEHRLIGCVTFDRVYPKPGHKVIHITLLAVRKRFRKMCIGQYLTGLVCNPVVSGKYDAILVNADHRATEFFEKQGFSGDVILNSKYEEIGDTWYNCKRMCYLPPYQSLRDIDTTISCHDDATKYYAELNTLDLKQMELDYMLYHEKSLQSFQCQALIMERLRKEVLLLRAKVSAQQDTIEALKRENYLVREEKFNCEKEFLNLKLKFLMIAADQSILCDDADMSDKVDDE